MDHKTRRKFLSNWPGPPLNGRRTQGSLTSKQKLLHWILYGLESCEVLLPSLQLIIIVKGKLIVSVPHMNIERFTTLFKLFHITVYTVAKSLLFVAVSASPTKARNTFLRPHTLPCCYFLYFFPVTELQCVAFTSARSH